MLMLWILMLLIEKFRAPIIKSDQRLSVVLGELGSDYCLCLWTRISWYLLWTCCWLSYTISLQRFLTPYRHTGYHTQCTYMEIETNGKIIYCFWNNCFSLEERLLIKQGKWHTGTYYYSICSVLISGSNTASFDFWSPHSAGWHGTRALIWLETGPFPDCSIFPLTHLLNSAGNLDRQGFLHSEKQSILEC